MTYNFDPEKWYDDELFFLKTRLKRGEITTDQYHTAIENLEKRLEEMWKRLDGTYQVACDSKKPHQEKS